MNARQKLKHLVSSPGYVIAPGAYDTFNDREEAVNTAHWRAIEQQYLKDV